MTDANSVSTFLSLRETFVCYADILGFRPRTERAFQSGEAKEFLKSIKASLGYAYEEVRQIKELLGAAGSVFDMKVFTDNIVVAYLLERPEIELGERELDTLLMLLARVQAGLAAAGFLLRGAISFGPHFQDEDIAYGLALLEAVDLDKSGGSPRLVIASSVEPWIARQLRTYGHVELAPHYDALLEDPHDGRLFVNYLDVVFENYSDFEINYALLGAHRETVNRGLEEYASDKHVLQKYEWLATYHNYVCRQFAEKFQIPKCEEAGSESAHFYAFGQLALNYLVSFDGQTPPQRLNPQRLLQANIVG